MKGMGRHSMEEVMERMDADLAACETLLEDSGAFLTGATPTQADCFSTVSSTTCAATTPQPLLAPCLRSAFHHATARYIYPGSHLIEYSG